MPETLNIGDRVQIAGKRESFRGGAVVAGHNYEGGQLQSYVVAFGEGGSDTVNAQNISFIAASPIPGGPRVAETLLTAPPGDYPDVKKVFFEKKPTEAAIQRTSRQISEAFRVGALGGESVREFEARQAREQAAAAGRFPSREAYEQSAFFQEQKALQEQIKAQPFVQFWEKEGPAIQAAKAELARARAVHEARTRKRPLETRGISAIIGEPDLPRIPYGTVSQRKPFFEYDITTVTEAPYTPLLGGTGIITTEVTETRRVGEPTFRITSPMDALIRMTAPPEVPITRPEQVPERVARGLISVGVAPLIGAGLAGKYVVEKKKAGVPFLPAAETVFTVKKGKEEIQSASIIGGLIAGGTGLIVSGFAELPRLVYERPAFGAGIVASLLVPGSRGAPGKIKAFIKRPKPGEIPFKKLPKEIRQSIKARRKLEDIRIKEIVKGLKEQRKTIDRNLEFRMKERSKLKKEFRKQEAKTVKGLISGLKDERKIIDKKLAARKKERAGLIKKHQKQQDKIVKRLLKDSKREQEIRQVEVAIAKAKRSLLEFERLQEQSRRVSIITRGLKKRKKKLKKEFKPLRPMTMQEIIRDVSVIERKAPRLITHQELALRRHKRKKGLVTEEDVARAGIEHRKQLAAAELRRTQLLKRSETRRKATLSNLEAAFRELKTERSRAEFRQFEKQMAKKARKRGETYIPLEQKLALRKRILAEDKLLLERSEARRKATASALETAFKEARAERARLELRQFERIRGKRKLPTKLKEQLKAAGLKETTYEARHAKAKVLFPAIEEVLRPTKPRPVKPRIVTAREILERPEKKAPPGYRSVEVRPGVVQLVKVKTKQQQRLLLKQKQRAKQAEVMLKKQKQLQKQLLVERQRLRVGFLPLQFQRQLVGPVQKQQLKQVQKQRQKLTQKQMFFEQQKLKERQKEKQRFFPVMSFKERQRQQSSERQPPILRERLWTRTHTVLGGMFPGLEEARRKLKKPKKKIREARPVYKPSLLAVVSGITAKKVPKEVTGIGIRPVITNKKARRLI